MLGPRVASKLVGERRSITGKVWPTAANGGDWAAGELPPSTSAHSEALGRRMGWLAGQRGEIVERPLVVSKERERESFGVGERERERLVDGANHGGYPCQRKSP